MVLSDSSLYCFELHAGEESPTGGTAFIFGKDICSNPKAARQLVRLASNKDSFSLVICRLPAK